mgnify:CR=1 FL=1
MGKMREIMAGVGASAAILTGGLVYESAVLDPAASAAIEQCSKDFSDPDTQKHCIDQAHDRYENDLVGIAELVGVVGIIGCGYLGYKRIRQQNGGTGIIDDYA